jgi:ribosomal protein S3
MGQKINPISLRLNINRNFDSSWFKESSTKYNRLLHQDLKIREYLKSLFDSVGIKTGRINFRVFPKKVILYYFFHQPNFERFRGHSREWAAASHDFRSPQTSQRSFQSFLESESLTKSVFNNQSLEYIFAKPKVSFIGEARVLDLPSFRSITSSSVGPSTFNKVKLQRNTTAKPVKFPEYVVSKVSMVEVFKKKLFLNIFLSRYFLTSRTNSSQNTNIFYTKQYLKHSFDFLKNSLVSNQGAATPIHLANLQTTFEIDQSMDQVKLKLENQIKELNAHLPFTKTLKAASPCNIVNPGLGQSYVCGSDVHYPQSKSSVVSQNFSNYQQFPQIGGESVAPSLINVKENSRCLKNIEKILSKNFKSCALIIPLKVNSRFQSAQFICEYVCQRLQENISFRQIFKQLLQDLRDQRSNKASWQSPLVKLVKIPENGSNVVSAKPNTYKAEQEFNEPESFIKGIRVLCSGRLNGVEMARTESKKFGQTSLHVFSSQIDYASENAYTLYGLIGVKVWLCFRE